MSTSDFLFLTNNLTYVAVKKIQSNRAAENRPPLEMAKPNAIHHRAYFWDTVYSEHHYPITFTWLCLRPSSWDPVLGVEDCRLDPRDPPPIDVPMDVDISPAAVHATVSHDQKGRGCGIENSMSQLTDTPTGKGKAKEGSDSDSSGYEDVDDDADDDDMVAAVAEGEAGPSEPQRTSSRARRPASTDAAQDIGFLDQLQPMEQDGMELDDP